MALSKNIDFKGITINNAYFRVWKADVTKTNIKFGLSINADSNSEMLDSKTYSCTYDLSGENPIAQAYKYLKTLPEFEGAVDC